MSAPSILTVEDRLDEARRSAGALQLAILGADDVIDLQESALCTLVDAFVEKLDRASAALVAASEEVRGG